MQSKKKEKVNLYETLGIKDDVDTAAIKSAYKKLALVSIFIHSYK